jgi:hypothetical protein
MTVNCPNCDELIELDNLPIVEPSKDSVEDAWICPKCEREFVLSQLDDILGEDEDDVITSLEELDELDAEAEAYTGEDDDEEDFDYHNNEEEEEMIFTEDE